MRTNGFIFSINTTFDQVNNESIINGFIINENKILRDLTRQ